MILTYPYARENGACGIPCRGEGLAPLPLLCGAPGWAGGLHRHRIFNYHELKTIDKPNIVLTKGYDNHKKKSIHFYNSIKNRYHLTNIKNY